MSKITKLYENAGIRKEVISCPAKYYGYDCTRNNWDDADCSCDVEGYPPFTAEKQLELIKWLKDKRDFHTVGKWCSSLDSAGTTESCDDTFEQALAGLINLLWQDLTKEEQQQVKGILE